MELESIKLQTTWNDAAGALNSNFLKLVQKLTSIEGGLSVTAYHIQQTPLKVWKIQHNLGKYPNVKIMDSSKQLCFADVFYKDLNNVEIEFGSAQSGSVYLD